MSSRSAAIQIRAPSTTLPVNSSPHIPPVLGSPISGPSTIKYPPGEQDKVATRQPPLCRNVLIHGGCKFEKEGTCRFNHQLPVPPSGRQSSPTSPRKFSLDPTYRPSTAAPPGTISAALTTSAPVFIPGTGFGSSPAGKSGKMKLNKSAVEFAPSGLSGSDGGQGSITGGIDELNRSNLDASAEEWYGQNETHLQPSMYNPSNTSDPTSSYTSSSSTPYPSDARYHQPPHNPYAYEPEHHSLSQQANHLYGEHNYGSHGIMAGPSLSNFQRPLNYHLYAPPLPHSSNQHPHQLAINSFFLPASVRETLQKKSAAILQGPTHEVARTPEDLGVYHSLVVIDAPGSSSSSTPHQPGVIPPTSGSGSSQHLSKVFLNPSWIYKASCSLDGKAYILFRIEGVHLKQGQGEVAIGQVERWRKIRHPAVVNVREAFTTRAFGDHSIIFAFDYHPLSQSLYDEHLSGKKKSGFLSAATTDSKATAGSRYHRQRHANVAKDGVMDERLLWSYIVQIANAIRIVHAAQLAVRTIHPTKILLTGANRVRINGCGILDVIAFNPSRSLAELQQQDLVDLGKLIVSLGSSADCSNPNGLVLAKGVEYVQQCWSPEINAVVEFLLQPETKTIDGLLQLIWTKTLDEVTSVFNHNDLLEEYLMRELENGRLVRLMTKFGFINERPEFDHDPNWSETSERYVLKLFRDYVFHQIDAQGKPVTDLSHVLMCLNKLDAGLDEKIMLVSRDDQTCVIVSYAEIRRILDIAFRDLTK
ncbi:hypothetical protein CROQUDRAFT_658780 [Cronartium quercuum f. sp. fusiforme G11]|uniref:PAN2-PAN3 deadenylation complex subunit PAN3 n=1 Tax=Cronartium quercuum f. sp. fusiforme G11 TaxID=708437 RepID=A0A9P6NKR5_9BASI|nr:hypothetical protein CROQUDRAFT_658780 [Cronartium quercuum f. sp. fusiforme G11]